MVIIVTNYTIYNFYKILHLPSIACRLNTSKRLSTISFPPCFTIFPFFNRTYPILTYHVARPLALPRAQRAISGMEHVKLISNHVSKPRNASGYPASALFIARPAGANLINRSNMVGGTFGLRKRTPRVYPIFPFFFFLIFQGHRHDDTRMRLKTPSASLP